LEFQKELAGTVHAARAEERGAGQKSQEEAVAHARASALAKLEAAQMRQAAAEAARAEAEAQAAGAGEKLRASAKAERELAESLKKVCPAPTQALIKRVLRQLGPLSTTPAALVLSSPGRAWRLFAAALHSAEALASPACACGDLAACFFGRRLLARGRAS